MRALRWLIGSGEEVLVAVTLAVMATLAFINVITRYFFLYSFAFTEEVEVNLFVWLALLAGAIAFKRRAHLRVVFFADRLPKPLKIAGRLLALVCTLAVFGVLIWYSWRQIRLEMLIGAVSEALGIPQWLYTLGVPIGSALCMIRAAEATLADVRGLIAEKSKGGA